MNVMKRLRKSLTESTTPAIAGSSFGRRQPVCLGKGCHGAAIRTMQRIYNDGKASIEDSLPDGWAKPAKLLNHRCPTRVVELINRVRSDVDDHLQRPVVGKADGVVRFFSLSSELDDKPKAEAAAAAVMARLTGDAGWLEPEKCKALTLEHSMAAKRMGFLEVFSPLQRVDRLKTGLLDGTLPVVRFFTHTVLPLVKAKLSISAE